MEQKKLKTVQKSKPHTTTKAGAKRTLVVSGKRKQAIAKAVPKAGSGKLKINKIPIELFRPDVPTLRLK